MNTLNTIARSLSQRKNTVPVKDLMLSRRNYYSNPVRNVEALNEVKEIQTNDYHSSKKDENSMYSDIVSDVVGSDKIVYADSVGSRITYGTTNNDIITSYTSTCMETACCDNNSTGLKVMFLECGHFVHTKCVSDDLISGKVAVCHRCAYTLQEDETKCVLIKSTAEYNVERERLEKQKQNIQKTISEYTRALEQCVNSLDTISKTSLQISEMYSSS